MGWGPEPIWSTATVTRNFKACPSGTCVSLSVDVEDGSDFVHPGQYVQVRPAGAGASFRGRCHVLSACMLFSFSLTSAWLDSQKRATADDGTKPIFLAIASAPTGAAPAPVPPGRRKAAVETADEAAGSSPPVPVPATWEFLVKETEFNSWIVSAPPGTAISVSQVMGSGFPISDEVEGFKYDFPTQNLLLFATGSGIAPIRSAIESGRLGISGGRTCTLYYGVRTPDDLCYVSKFPEWEGGGVSVVPVISQPEESATTTWMGRTGYVQNALEEDGVPIPRNSAALLCGVNGMCDGVKAMLLESGVFEGRVLKNF